MQYAKCIVMHIVSITTQGQISIPAKLRRQLRLDKTRRAIVRLENNRVVIEPVRDLLELKGSLKACRQIPPEKARAAFEDYLAKRAK